MSSYVYKFDSIMELAGGRTAERLVSGFLSGHFDIKVDRGKQGIYDTRPRKLIF